MAAATSKQADIHVQATHVLKSVSLFGCYIYRHRPAPMANSATQACPTCPTCNRRLLRHCLYCTITSRPSAEDAAILTRQWADVTCFKASKSLPTALAKVPTNQGAVFHRSSPVRQEQNRDRQHQSTSAFSVFFLASFEFKFRGLSIPPAQITTP
ncbi:hypothetical protein BDY17DRAFT_147179 [Neohortaea acidophila]|uniref:Uncharacterized protein n=1 Tax=Neohortaea acidophila TaxID=245834 RepID=A0A6A6PUG3_9PEZI|nr:uncharacterized protein BDY17DRAFT_147179 [Neohortaea acidophila]KAF2483406.1 hypothetical protein BDY17DRAFT_147179 [Neohortaea acidophila]